MTLIIITSFLYHLTKDFKVFYKDKIYLFNVIIFFPFSQLELLTDQSWEEKQQSELQINTLTCQVNASLVCFTSIYQGSKGKQTKQKSTHLYSFFLRKHNDSFEKP